jgi:hypothetical protein
VINKKNLLGKAPSDLGVKDAIHVAIVAVRAGKPTKPGERCKLNEHREAVPDEKGVGVADPFLKSNVPVGKKFWLLLAQDQVPNVQHTWEHPKVSFAPPEREPEQNSYLLGYAKDLGLTYEQLMEACEFAVENEHFAPYYGTLSPEDLEKAWEKDVDIYDIWSNWADQSGHEFENTGTECCPEYQYPDQLFDI